MKKNIYYLMLLAFISSSSCTKDYPDDIPDWIKKEIREYKNEVEQQYDCSHHSSGSIHADYYCLDINELDCNGVVLYEFATSTGASYFNLYYDFSGNYLCGKGYSSGIGNINYCYSILDLDSCSQVRNIFVSTE